MSDNRCFRLTVDSKITVFQIKKSKILAQFSLFQEHSRLFDSGEYTVISIIAAAVVEQFVSFIEGGSINSTAINWTSFWSLGKEFGFGKLRIACFSFPTCC
jgi:hypothetical protein